MDNVLIRAPMVAILSWWESVVVEATWFWTDWNILSFKISQMMVMVAAVVQSRVWARHKIRRDNVVAVITSIDDAKDCCWDADEVVELYC